MGRSRRSLPWVRAIQTAFWTFTISFKGKTYKKFMFYLSAFGSGSFETASYDIKVVADQEQMQANEVHVFGLGEGQGPSDKTG